MKNFLKTTQSLKRRIIFQKFIRWMIIGAATGGFLTLGLIILSKWFYIQDIWALGAAMVSIGISVGVIGWLISWPRVEEVVRTADQLGFRERFVTAYEILKNGSAEEEICKLVIEDAMKAGEHADFKKLYRFTYSKKALGLVLLLFLGSLIVGFIPSPRASILEEKKIVTQRVKEQLGKIQKIEKELKDNTLLGDDKKQGLQKEIEKIKKDLKQSGTKGELLQSMEKHQIELKKIEKQASNEDLQNIGRKLSSHSYTKSLGEQLQKGNIEEIEKQLQELQEKVKQMSSEELKELADLIQEMAEEIMEDEELKKALEDFRESLKDDKMQNIMEEYQHLGQVLRNKTKENQALKQAVDQLDQTMSRETKGNTSNPGDSQNPEGAQGESTDGTETNNGSSQGRGRGHIPNENIFVRELEDKKEEDVQVEGQQMKDGQFYKINQEGQGTEGESIPYKEVIQQYKSEALEALKEEPVPPGMQELIEEYFSSFE